MRNKYKKYPTYIPYRNFYIQEKFSANYSKNFCWNFLIYFYLLIL